MGKALAGKQLESLAEKAKIVSRDAVSSVVNAPRTEFIAGEETALLAEQGQVGALADEVADNVERNLAADVAAAKSSMDAVMPDATV
jgi:hypothetical protein